MQRSDFETHVHQALARLYDPVYLRRHPLGKALGLAQASARQPGEALRKRLLEAIDEIKPDDAERADVRAWRPYQIMQLRYVEALDAPEVQQRLAVAKSQYYREHQRGLDALVDLLWDPKAAEQPVHEHLGPAIATPGGALPRPLTNFIGRSQELGDLQRMLAGLLPSDEQPELTARLVSLTGPAGTGKTRLALELASELSGRGARVHFIPLATTTDPELVIEAIAHGLGLTDDQPQALLERLRLALSAGPLLLILDNMEQVLDARMHVLDLVQRCPQLHILITSREPLEVYGEHDFRVPPLAVPARAGTVRAADVASFEAVRLFVARAWAVKRDFALTDDTAPAVVELCAKLDGLPLAIELAAARSAVLTPAELVQRLSGASSVLAGGPRDWPERHRTLRNAIAWSYDLLSPSERVFLSRLGVFSGGCTLEAAEAVCVDNHGSTGIGVDEVLDLLSQLASKSLIVTDSLLDGQTRYRLLETVRQFALEQLQDSGQLAVLQRQHAGYFAVFAEALEPQIHGPDQPLWLERAEQDHDNFRAAMAWALERGDEADEAGRTAGAELALRIANGLTWFWYVRGYSKQALEWLQSGLILGEHADPWIRQKATTGAAGSAWALGNFRLAQSLAEDSLARYRDLDNKMAVAVSLMLLALCALYRGDLDRAETYTREWSETLDVAGMPDQASPLVEGFEIPDQVRWSRCFNRHTAGHVALFRGDVAGAIALYEEAVDLSRGRLASTINTGMSLHFLSLAKMQAGQLDEAMGLLEQAVTLFQRLGAKAHAASSLSKQGLLASLRGDVGRAHELLTEALMMQRDVADRMEAAQTLSAMAGLALASGKPEEAAVLLAAVEALREVSGIVPGLADQTQHAQLLQAVKGALSEAAFNTAWTVGRAMSTEQAMAYALAPDDAAKDRLLADLKVA